MFWFLLCAIVGWTIVIAWIAWRNWIAPWRQIEQLVRQTARRETPSTFLVGGAATSRRVGLALENIFQHARELDKQIAKRESGTQTIFSAMQDGLLVVDSDRRLILANETFRKLFVLPDTSAGAPLLEIVRDPTLDRLIADALRAGEPRRTELARADSQLELNAVPTRNEAGEITGAVILFHDITQLKQLDQIRSDFVANVSHELRTPLSILRGYIETLREHPKLSRQESAGILEVMERHSERLGLIVEDLLTLAQLESGNSNLQWSDVQLSELFSGVMRDWENKFAKKQLKVVVDLLCGLPIIRADEARLREVFDNLLDNAVKYSREHGEIRLQAGRRNDQIVVSVTDNGIGIGREDLPRIFERFYRADKARSRELGGTGLGLAIVKHITQLHGGRVEAESELGRGTTIRVMLPVDGVPDRAAVTES
jgi:two-component system, OmpR family, phosphate regulon sensor histidine kinase PhoR